MAHLSQRWIGIVLRIIRGYYPDGEVVVWGPLVEDAGGAADPGAYPGAESAGSTTAEPGRNAAGGRLELVLVQPPEPAPDTLMAIRADLERSDLPVPCDLRVFNDLTIPEQDEALERGIRLGG